MVTSTTQPVPLSPPSEQSPNPTPAYSISHLDTLLATYLAHLDTYTRLRSSLSSTLQSGFLSLAQAQRSSVLPPGQRYGQDMYDGRMKAGRRARVRCEDETEKTGRMRVLVYSHTEPTTEEKARPAETSASEQDSPPAPAPRSPGAKPKSTPRPLKDPLNWFGILTPAPLRACQNAFITATTTTIPELLTTERAMAELEGEIAVVREALGLGLGPGPGLMDRGTTPEEGTDAEERASPGTGDDEDGERDVDAETEEELEEELEENNDKMQTQTQTQKTASPSRSPSSQRRSLATRGKVAEPRSRVLKLGS